MLADPFLERQQSSFNKKKCNQQMIKKKFQLKITLHECKMHRTTPTLTIVLICRSIFHENLN